MPSPLANERRRSPRLPVVPNRVLLQWWERSHERSAQGEILDISTHGALLSADSFLDLGEHVHIRLKRPVRSDWAGSIVVRRHREHKVAIDFIEGCPYDLGIAATLGLDLIGSLLDLDLSDRFSNSGD